MTVVEILVSKLNFGGRTSTIMVVNKIEINPLFSHYIFKYFSTSFGIVYT